MGYNTTIVVMNDCLSEIKRDEKFGAGLYEAVLESTGSKQADIKSGCCCNAATVIESHHADGTAIIAVGGNCGTVLHHTFGWDHTESKFQVRLVKELAEKLGYRLVHKKHPKNF